MSVSAITVVYHPKCSASIDFLIKTKQLSNVEIQYINYETDSFDTSIEIDIVPMIIIDNNPMKIFKGKSAFDKIDEISESLGPKKSKNGLSYGQKNVTFMPEDSNSSKTKIDLDAKF